MVVVVCGAAAALFVWRWRADAPASSSSAAATAPAPTTAASVEAPASAVAPSNAPLDPATAQELATSVPYPVDLEALRAKIPDNLYWELGAPTSDVEVAKRRAERARLSNEAYGRIQANEATEAQIRDYYTDKRRISTDYLELATLVLKEQGDNLPERDRGLFEFSANLHRERLTQIDRDQRDALERLSARRAAGSGDATPSPSP